MKQRDFEKCVSCGRGMAAAGVHFFRVEVEQFVFDCRAIERQVGLQMIVGSAELAAVLGPDEDLAVGVLKRRGLLCADCGRRTPAAVVLEAVASTDEEPFHG